jgi:hypothetical protein
MILQTSMTKACSSAEINVTDMPAVWSKRVLDTIWEINTWKGEKSTQFRKIY